MQSISKQTSGALELVAGPFHAAIASIWTGQDVGEYLLAENARRHVWHACLSSEFCTFDPIGVGAAHVYDRFKTWKSKDLIVQAYGSQPRGLVKLLGRLGAEPRPPEIYRSLVAIMESGGSASKMLMHAQLPSDSAILTLDRLPAAMDGKTLRTLYRRIDEIPEDLALFRWIIERAERLWRILISRKYLRPQNQCWRSVNF